MCDLDDEVERPQQGDLFSLVPLQQCATQVEYLTCLVVTLVGQLVLEGGRGGRRREEGGEKGREKEEERRKEEGERKEEEGEGLGGRKEGRKGGRRRKRGGRREEGGKKEGRRREAETMKLRAD